MTAREEAGRRFAGVMGWCGIERGLDDDTVVCFVPLDMARDGEWAAEYEIDFPAPDAPLHEHLAFVGRVAEAIEVREFAIESPTYRNGDEKFRVTFWPGISACSADATDLSLAALLAGCAAKEKQP